MLREPVGDRRSRAMGIPICTERWSYERTDHSKFVSLPLCDPLSVRGSDADGRRACRLPAQNGSASIFGEMDSQPEFADVFLGWNESGLGVVFEVHGKSLPIFGEPNRSATCDGLTLWIDTRDNRTIHRANRFCQKFFLLAHDGTDEGIAAGAGGTGEAGPGGTAGSGLFGDSTRSICPR